MACACPRVSRIAISASFFEGVCRPCIQCAAASSCPAQPSLDMHSNSLIHPDLPMSKFGACSTTDLSSRCSCPTYLAGADPVWDVVHAAEWIWVICLQGDPVYAPQRVSFAMGGVECFEANGTPRPTPNILAALSYQSLEQTTPEFSMLKDGHMQPFVISPTPCFGGLLQVCAQGTLNMVQPAPGLCCSADSTVAPLLLKASHNHANREQLFCAEVMGVMSSLRCQPAPGH